MIQAVKISTLAVILMAVFLCLCSGCTENERNNYSPIPQNSPTTWEMRPYGDMQN